MPSLADLKPYLTALDGIDPLKVYGKVVEITGIIIKATGLKAAVGESCRIFNDGDVTSAARQIDAEIVGFKDGKALIMATSDISGIKPGSRVLTLGRKVSIKVSPALVGRVIDENGSPLDGKGPIKGVSHPILSTPPSPLSKERIHEPIDLGVKVLNGLLTVGKGQRIGIMAGAGVGKSVLMGMMARYTKADVNVIALVGERGREVREFMERDLGPEGMKRSVMVVSTSEQSPVSKVKSAFVATAIAEYFRDRQMDVLLFMDSLTRVAMAQREMGLAVGEPPASKGYTPSVFSLLPKLLERAGTTKGKGSITGLYTVLVEGDDLSDPVADSVMSIIDGHIVLSRELAMEGHYPAVDVLRSISRVMPDITDQQHLKVANKFIETMATYKRFEDMINLGAYKEGSNPKVDYAIAMIDRLNAYLKQGIGEHKDYASCLSDLYRLFGVTQQ